MPRTERYPWTDDEIQCAYNAALATTVGFDLGDIREILRGFHEAGIKVEIPGPRFTVMQLSDNFEVWDEKPGEAARLVATFNKRHHPDAQCAAREEAERLNRVHDDNA